MILRLRKLQSIFVVLLICLTFPTFTSVRLTEGQIEQNYTYYGVVPSKIYVYTLNDVNNLTSGWILGNETALNTGSPFHNGFTVALKSMLAIVASEDDTNIEIFDLSTSNRIS